jgi:hypothetical protein
MRALACSLTLLASCQGKSDHGSAAGSASGSSSGSATVRTAGGVDLTKAVGNATHAAIGDLDGDGVGELVVVDAQRMRVLDATGRERASIGVESGIQVLITSQLDNARRATIYAGWGQSREHMAAKAKVTAHVFDGTSLSQQTVLEPETPRNEVLALVPIVDKQTLLVAYFSSKYSVSSVAMRLDPHGWVEERITTMRMATTYARGDVDGDHKTDLVIGRVYGDDVGVDGDAFVLRPDLSTTPIPTTRGVRSLAVADTNGDGIDEVFLGDGWHQNYGKFAKGLLTTSRAGASGFTSTLIEDTAGQFEISRILPAKVNGETVIVTLGSAYVRVFQRNGDSWSGTTLANGARDIAVGDVDGKPGDELLIVGPRSELVDLRAALR